MMGKRSKRPGRAAPDIHARIKATAEKLNAAPTVGVRDADELPDLAALLEAGREAVASAVPKSFTFKGRTYWLRCRLAVQLDVFSEPGQGSPLVRGVSVSTEDQGHAPGH